MPMSRFLTQPDFPYCKGCGHHLVAQSTVGALETLGLEPHDVVLVTDIGCHGIVDRAFATHTVHGLHGRSVALGSGIAMGLPRGKQVLVFIGDGGATIGLQHLLEAARLNVDLTVVVHNNMVYGMTGGQPSGLTPCGFGTAITREGSPYPHHDLSRLVHDAGAAYARRLLGLGSFATELQEAMSVEGFALIEVLVLCPSYALKMNPGLRLRQLAEEAGYEPALWRGEERPVLRGKPGAPGPSLLREEAVGRIEARFRAALERRVALVLGGSAGEGVQRAGELLAQAAMASGLHATKKGRYPVTVGVGFSTAEVILSPRPIRYHGISACDAAVISSADGLADNLARIRGMESGTVWLDASLEVPTTGAEVRVRDFRGYAGPQNAAIYALLTFMEESGLLPVHAMLEVVRQSSIGRRVPGELLEKFE